jgi:hypothetical protein
MHRVLNLTIAESRLIRHGADYWWSCILDITRSAELFSFKELDGLSDPYKERYLGRFLMKLERAGFIEKGTGAMSTASARVYRLLKRQSQTPVISFDSKQSVVGQRQQNMWNVMRRRHQGFTIDDLVLDASTEDAIVARNTAKQYVMLLERAGILVVTKRFKPGRGCNIYVLKGSANTGPKPPSKMKASMVYDPNRGVIVGAVTAEEDL